MKKIAVILAGGSGKRMGLERPKQFLSLAGKTILEHSVDAFAHHEAISAVIIVSNPDFVSEVEAIVDARRQSGDWEKVTGVVAGGKERSDSSVNAVRFVEGMIGSDAVAHEAPVALLLHDAVRPLVGQRIISEVCEALEEHAAVNVTLPVVDTIISTTDGVMTGVVDRSLLQRVQTPQGFHLTTIREAYRRALADPDFRATDDCGVVLRYMPEMPITIVRGSENNLKLTYRDDIPLFEFLLKQQ